MISFNLKKVIISLLIFIAVFHFLAFKNFWYWKFLWLDMPVHFLGGFWVAMVFIEMISQFKIQISKPFNFIFGISFAALIGILLEIAEFLHDIIFQNAQILQMGAADTVGDLFFDIFGAAIFLAIYHLYHLRKKY